MTRIRFSVGLILFVLLAVPASAQESPSPSRPGATGQAGIDPSENVKALSEAANKRQDDLRALAERLVQVQIDSSERLNALRYDHMKELSSAQDKRIDEVSKIRAEYNERLAVAEAKRIDAIRAVDVNAVAVASTRATDQASVLATQVSQSAEALRALVATTAATVAQSQQQLANTLSARLTTLEQAGYQFQGKQTIQDPAFIALMAKVEQLSQARASGTGVETGRSELLGGIALALIVLAALGGLAFRAFGK